MIDKLKKGLDSAAKWCGEHKEALVIAVPAVTAVVAGVSKLGSKALSVYKEKNLQDKTIYDRSLGHYWQLNRKLSNDECLYIERRRKNGERLSDILNDMRVLK